MEAGLTVHITTVFEFPISAGAKTRVNFESRKGICKEFFLEDAKRPITVESVNKLLFI
jgi:hypothetical protein